FFILLSCLCFFFFFFSSRRRHTRFSRDWSSDVCSSDLAKALSVPEVLPPLSGGADGDQGRALARGVVYGLCDAAGTTADRDATRSEERRVGKECRSRRSPQHEKKKKRERAAARGSDEYT